MNLQSIPTSVRALPGYLASTGYCPGCGDRLVAPESSEFVDGGEIRHHWLCDACGHEFCTALTLEVERAAGE
jgi:hypothetical protein